MWLYVLHMNNFTYYSNQCRQSQCFDLRGIQTNDTAETQGRQYCAMQISGEMFNIKHFTEPVGHCATCRKFEGLISDGVFEIFHQLNPSGHTTALRSNQP
jgi:hypothetical protein